MTVLVDTNVLIDVFTMRQPHFVDSDEFLNEVFLGTVQGALAGHCLSTAYYLIDKLVSPAAAFTAVDKLLLHLDVVGLDKTGWLQARSLPMEDFEDAAVAVSAERCGASYIVTRNLSDFANSPIPAMSPGDFVKRFILPPP